MSGGLTVPSCSWPARIESGRDGLYHVFPVRLPDCECAAPTREEAILAAQRAIQAHFVAQQIVLPPLETLSMDALEKGDLVRIEIEMPD
jgi:predicted RNase H-like HicB family nuclease